MINYHQDGNVLPVVADSDKKSGEPVLIGDAILGFWKSDVADGEVGQVQCYGMVKDAPKATGTAWEQGAPLTFDGTEFDVAGDGDLAVGHAGYAAESADSTGFVLIGVRSALIASS